jgi:DNA-nicking Smr family endonuclease
MSRRRRGLSSEERALWESVARTAAPLRPAEAPTAPEAPVVVAAAEPKGAQAAPRSANPVKPGAKAPAKPAAPPLHPIERRTLSRVARGTMAIDSRIDLHGMTQSAAHERLHRFLRDAQASGARIVLVITGKGRPGSQDEGDGAERGVLRRRVPHWLSEPAMRQIVLGFDEAHRSHGGGGALYVRIRRPKTPGGVGL